MISFGQLWMQMEADKERASSPLMDSGEENRGISAVRSGKDMHKEEDRPFWDEFIELCADREGMADLLGVTPEKISTWPEKIKSGLDELEKHNAESPSVKDDMEVIPTGDTGAVTMPGNADPYLGEM